MIPAREIMSEDVITIHEDMTISQVAHLMLRDRVSAFPVVRGTDDLVGIITLTDLFSMIDVAVQKHGRDVKEYLGTFKNLRVAEVMSHELIVISPETSLLQIIRFIVEKHVHSFPVVEEGRLVGIVSRHDILNAVFGYL